MKLSVIIYYKKAIQIKKVYIYLNILINIYIYELNYIFILKLNCKNYDTTGKKST